MRPKSSGTGSAKKICNSSDRGKPEAADISSHPLHLGPCHYLADVIALPNQIAVWTAIAARRENNAAKIKTSAKSGLTRESKIKK
ncbi:MAG: hypothetical protein V7703_05650 [Hyphomicrobiales bacterium]